MSMNMPTAPTSQEYDYTSSGIDNFLSRSIETVEWQTNLTAYLNYPEGNTASLSSLPTSTQNSNELNLNQSPTTGSLGSTMQVGSIQIDGTTGAITVGSTNTNNAVAVIGGSSGGF